MKKTQPVILICYSANDWRRSVPFSDHEQRLSYEMLYTEAYSAYGIQMVRASLRWFNGKEFTKYWEYVDGKWKKRRKKLTPDLVLDKTKLEYGMMERKMQLCERFQVVNPWELDLLASDKLLTETVFHDFSPISAMVRTHEDIREAIKHIPGAEYIYKPRLGHGGKGIQFFTEETITELPDNELAIVQQVINTKNGIPGIIDGYHDLRIVFVGSKTIAAFVRTPAPGTRLCNISQGGKAIEIALEQVPQSLQEPIDVITKHFSRFPEKIYSTDFFFDENGRPYLIEINTKPIIAFPEEYRSLEQKIQSAYLEYFTELLKK